MIPLIPTLALAFLSFFCSAFVIFRIIVPILPPHPLSRRVSPAEFGLPNFRTLSPADKGHLWLQCLDLLGLIFFVWEALAQAAGGPSGWATSTDPAGSVRVWIVFTLRQTCLLVITAVALVHIRMGLSVSYGPKHWMLWCPTLLLAVTSTALACVLSGAGLTSLYVGLVAYTSTIALVSTATILGLVTTLVAIKRNLARTSYEGGSWPPAKVMEEKERRSFSTDDVDGLRDGASWITSSAGSRRESISAWSFSTHHLASHTDLGKTSAPPSSGFWFKTLGGSPPPPVPPLPSPYGIGAPSNEDLKESDPFKRNDPSSVEDGKPPRPRFGSQTSWLTSTDGTRTALSAWSFPTTIKENMYSTPNASVRSLNPTVVSRPATPVIGDAQVLGGYGYQHDAQSTQDLDHFSTTVGTLDVSFTRSLGWFFFIWFPLALSYPYVITSLQHHSVTTIYSILLTLSATLSGPILAINVLFISPLPIPEGLFDVRNDLPRPRHSTLPMGSVPSYKWSHEYKRSTSLSVTPTVVEGRRSGDVWVTNGNASDGKGKMSRAFSLLAPQPKLSVLPTEDSIDMQAGEHTPPLPIQDEESSSFRPVNLHNTVSDNSAQFGRLRNDSKVSSFHSALEESLAYASQVMIAQRHYSALAQTFKVSTVPSQGANDQVVRNSSVAPKNSEYRSSAHLRTRSVSSVGTVNRPFANEEYDRGATPPPSIPLPPTPPNVRAAKLARHKKSYSSSGYSFSRVDDMNEIDALTAGVLPLLVPGLKVGDNMKIKKGDWTPPGTFSKAKNHKLSQMLQEFGGEFSSPEDHSTPATAQAREPRGRKASAHKRNHWSLPSLSLGKDGIMAWGADLGRVLENTLTNYTAVPSNVNVGRRNTVFGGEAVANALPGLREDEEPIANQVNLGRSMSTRSLGLRPEVPHGVGTARSSVASMNILPPSAASTATLFEIDENANLSLVPQAESTPHQNDRRNRTSRRNAPPVPSNGRRSSIIYIRSENDENQAPVSNSQRASASTRPLVPRSAKLQRKNPNPSSSPVATSPTGLRPLSLLQARDMNTVQNQPQTLKETRPLQLAKKMKTRLSIRTKDENAYPESSKRKAKNTKGMMAINAYDEAPNATSHANQVFSTYAF